MLEAYGGNQSKFRVGEAAVVFVDALGRTICEGVRCLLIRSTKCRER